MSTDLTLWKLTHDHRELLSQLYDPETGEVNLEVDEKIKTLMPDIEQKCIGVNQWISKLKSDKEELERLEAHIKERKAAYDKSIKAYQEYLIKGMEENGIKEIVCPYFTIKLKRNPHKVETLDEGKIPENFFSFVETLKIEKKPNRTKILEYFKSTGENVPGTEVVQRNRLEILIDKI